MWLRCSLKFKIKQFFLRFSRMHSVLCIYNDISESIRRFGLHAMVMYFSFKLFRLLWILCHLFSCLLFIFISLVWVSLPTGINFYFWFVYFIKAPPFFMKKKTNLITFNYISFLFHRHYCALVCLSLDSWIYDRLRAVLLHLLHDNFMLYRNWYRTEIKAIK